MIIGKAKQLGVLPELNTWYYGIEILSRPPTLYGGFRPVIFIWLFNFIQYGEYGTLESKPEIYKGFGMQRFIFPFGIRFNIEIFR